MKYSVVIPTYNHCEDLLKPCLESIFRYSDMTDIELVIVANGCTDNTHEYLESVSTQFEAIGFGDHFKYIISEQPLGYAQSTNWGIKSSTGQRIILLNNDTVLLNQERNYWINLLESPFLLNKRCGVSGPVKQHSPEAGHDFLVFFCVMVDRQVFDDIGLINTEYGQGGGEDTEFCIEAERAGYLTLECVPKFAQEGNLHIGGFPIYHAGEKTVHDQALVPNYEEGFQRNQLTLARKYNREYYKHLLRNNFERHVNFAGEPVPVREAARYKWAAKNLIGEKVLEIGCSTGYGTEFIPLSCSYTGIDYDRRIVEVAQQEFPLRRFEWGDVNTYSLDQYDTIIAFEVIEHLDNGLEIVEKLKNHCKRLLITIPYKETPGFWGEHHKIHMLDESHLPGFKIVYCNEQGDIGDTPFENTPFNLMLCLYDTE